MKIKGSARDLHAVFLARAKFPVPTAQWEIFSSVLIHDSGGKTICPFVVDENEEETEEFEG